MLPSEVIMSYENLLSAFEDISAEANCGFVLKAQNTCACFKPEKKDRESFECLIHCKDWKWKSSTDPKHKTKIVNIVVAVHEKIRRHDPVLLSSVVEVSYLDVIGDEAQLLQSLHFDYDPCQRDHALFHAQVSDEMITISQEQLAPLKIDFSLPQSPVQTRHRSVRIPTCDMTFSSVLVSLTADHIGGPFFRKFQAIASAHQQKMPLPLIQKLCRSLGSDTKDIRSSHWYCHTRSRKTR
jgi:hypothetical protein